MSWLALLLLLPLQPAQDIPDRPEKLKYKPLTFNVPDPAAMRTELPSGAIVYLLEDSTLPMVDIVISFRRGGQRVDLRNAELDPELMARNPWLQRKLLRFRAVPMSRRRECSW